MDTTIRITHRPTLFSRYMLADIRANWEINRFYYSDKGSVDKCEFWSSVATWLTHANYGLDSLGTEDQLLAWVKEESERYINLHR